MRLLRLPSAVLIPIFGSCPTRLSEAQDTVFRMILGQLGRVGLEWRSIGRTDYPHKNPLHEVSVLARHCSGGLILGFSQFETSSGLWKRGTANESKQKGVVHFPTPWNQIEAGILFALQRPLLVFRDSDIAGGVFDNGVTDLFIHDMPNKQMSAPQRRALKEVFASWASEVRQRYYAAHPTN
jgi:hypothetical protein